MNHKVTVQRFEPLQRGRYLVKIAEDVGMKTINYNGQEYGVTKVMGRGRYIVKALPNEIVSNESPTLPPVLQRPQEAM